MDKNNKENILILGAGPTGIAAGLELSAADKSFMLIEKEKGVGGLAKTIKYGEFITDIGPHRFFSKNHRLYELIENLLGHHWIKVTKSTTFYLNGRLLSYPIDIKNILLNIGLKDVSKIVLGYLSEQVKNWLKKREIRTFQDYAIFNFGEPLAKLNMLNYTEKIWGLPCWKISPDWAKQRIKGLSFNELLKNIFIKQKSGSPKTLIDEFHYPDEGIGMLFEKMKDCILSNNKESIRLNSHPDKIKHKAGRITEIDIIAETERMSLRPDYVISSIPITEFVSILEPAAPDSVLKAAGNLKFRSHISFFVTVNKKSVFPYHWVYFPEEKFPFGRVMEPKNWSKKMSPDNKTSLLVEFFCWENDRIWNASKEDLLVLTLPWLEKCGFLQKEEIIDYFIDRQKYAYPVYELNYRMYLDKVKNYLGTFSNLQCIGRSGIFRYNNIDHALEMGILAAKNILDGKRHKIEEVGTESEYFERGYVK